MTTTGLHFRSPLRRYACAARPPEGYAAAALKAFGDIQAFCEPLLKTKPMPIARNLVAEVPA